MLMRCEPLGTDVPYFPYPLESSEDGLGYTICNHLMSSHIQLDTQAAEVLRLADGEKSLSDIIVHLDKVYPDAGGSEVIGTKVIDLLRKLSSSELIWWRDIPLSSVPVPPPLSIFWEITSECNLRCLHCVVSAGEKASTELSTERCLSLAEELASLSVQNIAFSGGEPLIHPDFLIIAEKIQKLGMSIQVATNGTLVTPSFARKLLDLNAQVQVSLDGSKPEIHDRFRPGQNAFRRTITGIRNLIETGHQVTIASVLSTNNIHDIPAQIKLAEDIGATSFRLIPFVPKGRGEAHRDMEVSTEESKEVTLYLRDIREKTRLNIASLEFEEMLDNNIHSPQLDPNMPLKCGGAVSYATITPIGEVLPCHFFEGVRADNVQSTDFHEVWCCSRFLNYFRHLRVSDLHGKCGSCNWLSTCAGSCRAVNYAKGDLFGGNHACWMNQEI